MSTMTKKTTILFPPAIYHQLEQVAERQRTSVAHLVRQAAIQCYLVPDRHARRAAVEALAAMELPVAEWSVMEEEIARGAYGHS